MSSFITQHNATDVTSFEGACNWHADCRNVHQSCCLWIECSFLYHKPSPKVFQRIWQYIQPASQPQTTCNLNIQDLHLQDRLRPATRTAVATIGLHNQRISAQTVRNRLREAHLHAHRPHRGLDLTAVHRRNRLEWANAHIRWRLALWRGVFFTDESRFSLYRADGRQRVWRHVGERFADVNVVDRVAHGGSGVMVWAGVCYGQQTQVHFIDGILNAQRYRDPLLCHSSTTITSCCSMIMHGPMLQGSVHNSWKLKTSQFLHGQHTHRTCHPLSMFGMLWIGVYDSVFQFLPISSNFAQPLKRSGPTFHRPQSTTWSTAKEMCCTAWGKWWSHQILIGFRTPQYSKTAHFRVAFYCGQPKAHLCNNHAV